MTWSMAKSIKKTYKSLIVLAGIIILLPGFFFIGIRIPEVQTLLVRRITNHFSHRINSTLSIAKIEYHLFNRLKVTEVLIKDKYNDTLIYVPEASININKINLKESALEFGRIKLISPVVTFITDTAGEMNLMWYVNMLKGGQGNSFALIMKHIQISDARFSLINRKGGKSSMPVDFRNLNLSAINGEVEDFNITNDTVIFRVNELRFSESAGFRVNGMNSKVAIAGNDISLYDGNINCDSSIINYSLIKFTGDSATSFSSFIEDVKLDIRLNKSLISSNDLKYFVRGAEKVDGSVMASGRVSGTVAELRGRDIEIEYGDYSRLSCDFDISGLPEINSSFIYLGINTLTLNASDIEKVKLTGEKPILLSDLLHDLGNVTFTGSFTGFPEDFVAYGRINSKKGNIGTDISLRPEDNNRFKVKGLVRGNGIDVGWLTGNSDLFGHLTMKADIDGYAVPPDKFSGDLTGLIDSIVVNKYMYRNISLNGIFTEKTWDGSVSVSDSNIKLDVLGMFDFNSELPEFDFTLNLSKADLHNLNFDKTDSTSALSMLLTANFRGTNIDNLDGEIKLLNSTLRKYGESLDLYDFSVRTFIENGNPAISLRSDYVDADVRGHYSLPGLTYDIKKALSASFPSKFITPVTNSAILPNDFSYSINLKNTDKLNKFFRTNLMIAEKSSVNGRMISDSLMEVNLTTKNLGIKGLIFSDLTIDAGYKSDRMNLSLLTSSLNLFGQSELKDFKSGITTIPDRFDFSVLWDNQGTIINRGAFNASGQFIKPDDGRKNTVLMVNIDSTVIFSRNKPWTISPSILTVDSSSFNLSKFLLSNGENFYLVDGAVSENNTDTLNFEFRGIDISWMNALVSGRSTDPEKLSLSLKGKLNGHAHLADIHHNPIIESNLNISGFSLLESDYGDLSLIIGWNNERKVADIKAYNSLAGRQMIGINGYYEPERRRIDLNAIADKLPIDALNPLLRFFASGISGTTSGKVNLSGVTKELVLNGALMAENAVMKINYLQTKYKVNDTIRFDKEGIQFKNVKVTDERGNPATLNGAVRHKHFREYTADLLISTDETMVLNTRPKDNDLFYGTAFATGVTTIKSGPGSLTFDVGARTGRNTRFYIPLNSSETVSDYSFINFVSRDTGKIKSNLASAASAVQKTTGIELNFDLELTPDAEVQLIFDPKVGDIMKGYGSGNLNISLDKKGEFRISGDYIIEDGDYLFTLKNILNKPFSVEEGGRISFNGDIDNAEIEMKAIYKLKASLFEILKDEKFTEKIPVECQIDLSGKLFNPIVAFNIYLPMADEETRTYLKNIITTEEELSRQFLYLLVMNSFYSDPSYGTSITNTTATGTSAMAVTTTEMLSNQLSNWLSQISNDFDVGFTYLPGQKVFNDQEVQVALSTQLLNDRVIINGNLDVRGGTSSNNTDQLTGDFDIEYKLTDKIRFKVFNRYNNPYTGKLVPYTQGFGIFFRQDFDKFSDLFRKTDKSEMKKEEETAVQ